MGIQQDLSSLESYAKSKREFWSNKAKEHYTEGNSAHEDRSRMIAIAYYDMEKQIRKLLTVHFDSNV